RRIEGMVGGTHHGCRAHADLHQPCTRKAAEGTHDALTRKRLGVLIEGRHQIAHFDLLNGDTIDERPGRETFIYDDELISEAFQGFEVLRATDGLHASHRDGCTPFMATGPTCPMIAVG